MLMSAVKLVVDVGAKFIPGVGRVIDAGLSRPPPPLKPQQMQWDLDVDERT